MTASGLFRLPRIFGSRMDSKPPEPNVGRQRFIFGVMRRRCWSKPPTSRQSVFAEHKSSDLVTLTTREIEPYSLPTTSSGLAWGSSIMSVPGAITWSLIVRTLLASPTPILNLVTRSSDGGCKSSRSGKSPYGTTGTWHTLMKSSACGVRSPGLFAIPWTFDREPSCLAIDSVQDRSPLKQKLI